MIICWHFHLSSTLSILKKEFFNISNTYYKDDSFVLFKIYLES